MLCLLIFVISSCNGKSTQPTGDEISIVDIKGGWQYRFGDSPVDSNGKLIWLSDSLNSTGWTQIKSLSEIPNGQHPKSLWLRIVLPHWEGSNPAVYTGAVEQQMQVFLDSSKIYQFGEFRLINEPHLMGRAVHLVQLRDNFEGKLLTFRIYSDMPFIGLIGPIVLGSSFNIIKELFAGNLDDIIFSVLYSVSGLMLMIAFIFFRRDKLILGMAMFLISLGLWTGSNSVFLQIMMKQPFLFYIVDIFSFYSFPLGAFYLIENIIEGKYKKIARFLWQFDLVFIVISGIIILLPGGMFSDTFYIYEVFLSVSCIIGLTIIGLSARRGNIETKLLFIGMGICFSFGLLEITLYNNAWNYSPGYLNIGCGLFILILVWIFFRRYKRIYAQKEFAQQQAFEAIELEKETRSKYTQKLLSVQEDECKKISFELHDSVGQDLLVVKNLIRFGKKNKINVVEDEKYYETIFNSTSRAIDEVRDISRALHPVQLENLGLTQAIKSIINRINEASEIEFLFQIDDIDGIVKSENEIHVYRIIQESLNNIIKHSEASSANISVTKDESMITIFIKDNGKGFDTSLVSKNSKGLGLSSISERVSLLNGELNIKSGINKGTEIVIEIKLMSNN